MSGPPPMSPPKPGAKPAGKSYGVGAAAPKKAGKRVVVYGAGGVGKSTLSSLAPRPAFMDLEGGSSDMNVRRVEGIQTWDDILAALRTDALWADVDTIVIDSGTKAQEMCAEWVIANVPHEKGYEISRLEDYGFGKGYSHIYDEFCKLLAELDRHAEAGRNVILICHQTADTVPNPEGDDYLCYQPDLKQVGKTCKIRERVRGWCDAMPFLLLDVAVNKEGKAKGAGSRTCYLNSEATWWAKARGLSPEHRQPFAVPEGDDTLWQRLFGGAS